MDEPQAGRFVVVEEEDLPRGGLYELEQVTWYRVVDTRSGQVVLVLQGLAEASFSPETGSWDDYRWSGARAVAIAPDEQSVVVHYHDGRVEIVALPPWRSADALRSAVAQSAEPP